MFDPVQVAKLENVLPPDPVFEPGIRRAPDRGLNLSHKEIKQALKNALRYIPSELHKQVAPEFLNELKTMGRIYGYRWRPQGSLRGKPIDEYKGITQARALQVMIDNNLDFDIALYPYELVTYGETGQVCQNWMQYRLIMKYLQVMTAKQTLVVASGHPVGLFPSNPEAPRVISTNGLVIGKWDNPEEFKRLSALGVANYGQMTAGGWMYIGPQGIVHGTYITLLNAGRKYLGIPEVNDLAGVLYISSGLGGMSGAQAKAIEIAGGIGVIAEVDYSRIKTRHTQGWVSKVSNKLDEIFTWVDEARISKKAVSIAYHGNIVDLLRYCEDNDIKVELISDQTSCHAVYEGGYTPVGLSFEEGRKLLAKDTAKFKEQVDISLKKHFRVLQALTAKGSHFWDYGNSFMASVFDAGEHSIAKDSNNTNDGFIWPSYVEDIMGPMCFDYGYGPFRWVCLSRKDEDLRATDKAACDLIDPQRNSMDRDNYHWIKTADENALVVGTKARILYADEEGRIRIALKFNEMVRNGEIGPVILGRDHHDVSGTDSPFRETANIYDGSNLMADMATHCFAGNIARGMTLVVLSNGGGVGIGRSVNGGNGIVLDGSEHMDEVIRKGLSWDVMGGVARRAWARNAGAIETAQNWNIKHAGEGELTVPEPIDEDYIDSLL
ncbi:MAG: urocanate hydratase [Candidatus Cloacimonetes bacterium]|jgi:urocanate hydratase|nr:urocanate hydratase [Candidatus Cloacimonadota bacterium]MDY0299126.1 urocanate hydratase [Candidatus Cloacimonadaceae bacterium]MCB5278158.1 urocanate hydratase [Candidatus Cloacimonadota bacterium]MCK9332206.1 urocanate hydratase [Candidatus Cloacimonadota bacterium]MDD2210459.1 urocanate hydratase [Candidatus Cloacimonadota bacterium]